MTSLQRLMMLACTCVATSLACGEPEKPGSFGSIAVQIVTTPTVSGVPASSATNSQLAAGAAPSAQTGTLALEGVRVTVTGPTPKTATSTTPASGFFDVTLDQLAPGQYTVIVEGIVSTETDFYGSTSSVSVTAGQTATATVTNFATFVPTLASFVSPTASSTVTAKWSKVPTATSYVLQVSNNAAFTGATERTVPDTSALVTAPDTGLFYVRVRAANATVTKGHATTASTKTFRVVTKPTTLAVTPNNAAVTGPAGTHRSLSAKAFDANTDSITATPFVWASLNPAIATVDASGQLTTVSSGQVVVSATAGGLSSYALLTVSVPSAQPVDVWSNPSTVGSSVFMWAIWGTSATNAFGMGQGGVLVRWNGTTWSSPISTPAGTNEFRGMWGPAANDLYLVGGLGTILHSTDGNTWTSMTSNTVENLFGIWGSAPNDIWAIGSNGALQHWNGSSWNTVTPVNSNSLTTIWGTGRNVWAVGFANTILHYDGTSWSAATSPLAGTPIIYRVWGTSVSNVYATSASGEVLYFDGSNWSHSTPAGSAITFITGVSGVSANEVYASGASGTMLRWDGASWTLMPTGTSTQLATVWGTTDGPVLSIGPSGVFSKGVRGAATASYGETSLLANQSAWSNDYLAAYPITISATTDITHLSILAKAIGNQARLALYSDNAGSPNALLAQTNPFTITGAGTFEVPVTQSVRVAAGTYWIAAVYSAGGNLNAVGLVSTGGSGYRGVSGFAFATAFPTTYPAFTTTPGYRLNYYVRGFSVP